MTGWEEKPAGSKRVGSSVQTPAADTRSSCPIGLGSRHTATGQAGRGSANGQSLCHSGQCCLHFHFSFAETIPFKPSRGEDVVSAEQAQVCE